MLNVGVFTVIRVFKAKVNQKSSVADPVRSGARGSGICATNLAEMAVKIALRSATQCTTELRLETLIKMEKICSS